LATAPRLTAEQWAARTPQQALVIEEGIQREKVKPRSLAWVAHDGTALLVAFDHEVDKAKPLRRGNTWGQDDAVEIALRTAPEGPILVLRGYPSGHHEASDEAGAPPAAVKRATEGVTYTAQVVDAGRWTCTWRIPLAALGLDPAKDAAVEFNLSVRKTAGDQWLMWAGTLAHTWDVRDAGRLRLGR
jgi:hypothetical protein